MIFEAGYEYYTENVIDSFMGKLKATGYFVHDSETEYHGYVHILGKNRPLLECQIKDGNYYYAVEAVGLKITIDALVSDDHSINGLAYAKGHKPMKVRGGAVRRVCISNGKEEFVGEWQKK